MDATDPGGSGGDRDRLPAIPGAAAMGWESNRFHHSRLIPPRQAVRRPIDDRGARGPGRPGPARIASFVVRHRPASPRRDREGWGMGMAACAMARGPVVASIPGGFVRVEVPALLHAWRA